MALPFVISAKEVFCMEEMGTEAGAVMYQICFPSKFDFSNNCDASGASSSREASSKPLGGLYGEVSLKDIIFVVDALEDCGL
jgi:hypothetical protein